MFCTSCGKELTGTPEICARCGARPFAGSNYCQSCGATVSSGARICERCGARQQKTPAEVASSQRAGGLFGASPKSRTATTLFALFLGQFGAHRFYIGQIKSAVAMLVLTIVGYATIAVVIGFVFLAVVWVWNIIDFVFAVSGKLKDVDGRLVTQW